MNVILTSILHRSLSGNFNPFLNTDKKIHFLNRSRSGKRGIEVLNRKKLDLIFQKQLHPGNSYGFICINEKQRQWFKSHTPHCDTIYLTFFPLALLAFYMHIYTEIPNSGADQGCPKPLSRIVGWSLYGNLEAN